MRRIGIDPDTLAFSEAVEVATTKMIERGHELSAILVLAQLLSQLLSNDSWRRTPRISHSRKLSEVTGGIMACLMAGSAGHQLQDEHTDEMIARLQSQFASIEDDPSR